MKYKKRLICILFALLPVLCGCSQKTQTDTPETYGTFEFSVLKVGKADAIVMRTQNNCVVMDCGEKILDFLAQSGTERIDRLFITHFDTNPADEKTLNILNKYDSKIYLTKGGTVSVSSDGKTLNVTQDEN
ncbi:MAG: hypothetical protein SPH44_04000 [Eubacteriales bacterium]|nr:hypothetical protein [Eubacteriales bacterium]